MPVEASKASDQTIVVSNEPKIKIREKKVTTLSGSTAAKGPAVGFRKPKTGIHRSIRTGDCSDDN